MAIVCHGHRCFFSFMTKKQTVDSESTDGKRLLKPDSVWDLKEIYFYSDELSLENVCGWGGA